MRVDPYDPQQQTRLVTVVGPTVIPIGALVEEQIATHNPSRVWLLCYPDVTPSSFDLRPNQSGVMLGIRPAQGENSILIHCASYPGLCQGDWWCLLGSGANLIVWEGWASQQSE